MKLTVIEYDAIMHAIDHAYNALDQDTFIDPYAENPQGYTNETIRGALERVERMIISENLPY